MPGVQIFCCFFFENQVYYKQYDYWEYEQNSRRELMTLKSAKQPNFEMAYGALADEIYNEYMRHRYVLQSDTLLLVEKERYENLMNRRADEKEVAKAFAFLVLRYSCTSCTFRSSMPCRLTTNDFSGAF